MHFLTSVGGFIEKVPTLLAMFSIVTLQSNGHLFEADWLQCLDALSSNRKVDGSRRTGSTQACHS